MEYRHFSHEHNLSLYQVQQGQEFRCSVCETLCKDCMYACWHCGFFLHDHCGNANRFIRHPSHPPHPLILLPSPTYCGGTFLCNACAAPGTAVSYSCALCEIDLHLRCAFLPPEVTHKAHQHKLTLSFNAKEAISGTCKLCNKELQAQQWSYCCVRCSGFRVHTFCATDEVRPGLYVDGEEEQEASQGQPQKEGSGEEDRQEQLELSEDAVAQLLIYQLQMQMAEQILASSDLNSKS